jgi:N-acyl-D-amino-acid deacylase
MLDLIIKNGRIVDGSGIPGFAGDLGISEGKIVEVGSIETAANRTIDVSGKIVAPGFIDPHTHFDAQLLWDGQARPSIEHGITTIVPGNCSLSLAPLKAEHRMKLVGMFNQIEEMPIRAFEEGVEWDWETFEEFLARISKNLAINVAPLVGHSVLRLWVMGNASMERTATPGELAAMQDLLRTCLAAGAIGLSTSFVDMDETLQPVPSRYADAHELDSLCEVLGEYNRVLQIVPEFYNNDLMVARIDQLAELSLKYKITTTFSPLFVNTGESSAVTKIMNRVDEHFKRGAQVWPQVQTRPIDISFCFEVPSLLFIRLSGWYQIMRFGSHDDIVACFMDEDRRKQLVNEAEAMSPMWDMLVLREVNTDANQHLVGKNLAEIAPLRGTSTIETMIDLSLEEDLQAHFLAAGMGHNDDAMIGHLLGHPNVHIGASDGGAHILSFSTYGDTGYLFSHFVRECKALSLEEAVKKITSDTAGIWGMKDRGLIREGYIADITIFDPETIDRGEEYYAADVPGDGRRYVRDAKGIDTVIIGGEIAYRDGDYTNSACGKIIPEAVAPVLAA